MTLAASELRDLLPEALDLVQEAVDRETNEGVRASHQVHLAGVLYRLGRYHEALTALDQVRGHADGRASPWERFLRAMTYHHLGKAEEARQAY